MWDDELLEGKVSKLTLLEFQELSKNNLTGFTRLNLAFNPSSNSTKARLIHDFTCNIKQTTLSLELLTSEQCIGSLAEAQISFRMFHHIKCLDIARCYSQIELTGLFLYLSLNVWFQDIPTCQKPTIYLRRGMPYGFSPASQVLELAMFKYIYLSSLKSTYIWLMQFNFLPNI